MGKSRNCEHLQGVNSYVVVVGADMTEPGVLHSGFIYLYNQVNRVLPEIREKDTLAEFYVL